MTVQLHKIEKQFNKASESYDNVANVQKDAAQFLVEKLLSFFPFSPKTVLDLGTGTGYIPQLLLTKFPQCSFYLNDIANKMLEICKQKFFDAKNVYYCQGDMQTLNETVYDCIISNLALQWANDLESALKLAHTRSAKAFGFSTLLDGTFDEWKILLNKYQPIQPLKYPSVEHLIRFCNTLKKEHQTFQYWLMDVPLLFQNARDFMHYLNQLGASSSAETMAPVNLKKLLKAEHQNLTVTYKIFFGIFRKETP